jgi:hypothetical protein
MPHVPFSLVMAVLLVGAVPMAAQGRAVPPAQGASSGAYSGASGEVVRAERQLLDAMTARDSARMSGLLAPQFGLVSAASNGEIIPRAEWIRGVLDRRSNDRGEVLAPTVRLHAPTVATVVATVTWRVQDPGAAPVTERYVITDTWVRRGRSWQLAARHSSQRVSGP